MLGQVQRKSTIAQQFQEDATKIPCDVINFDKYAEFAEQLQEDDLRKYIEREMTNFQNDRLEEVSVFSGEWWYGDDVLGAPFFKRATALISLSLNILK